MTRKLGASPIVSDFSKPKPSLGNLQNISSFVCFVLATHKAARTKQKS